MNKKLYVGNLDWGITDQELGQFFTQAGKVVNAVVILNRDTGRSRGFGFVEMATEEEAQTAIQTLNNKNFNGRAIAVNEAKAERNEPRKSENRDSGLVKAIKDFERTAKVGEILGFSINNKHFTITRDDETPDINPPRQAENY